ncbi:potassium channel protein [Virgibacillus profundi]|uniref:Potassium channel protein n=1 Tax=Virgibacillus profundi TaxID=2024555 RepID=A0A2A2I9S9_9BACI|nr:potassium channel family protein [Virgibacillus profundi]PAV28761.1 potassium channel protein [Virgibacillus profundi]PXY52929.1 potassium channel protein [Virgibacillus profundi]
MSIRLFKHMYFRLPVIIKLLLTIFILMFAFGLIIHFVEPKEFPTIFDGIWWAFVTGATVGYGDYIPISFHGKVVAILLILSGGGLIAYYITTFAATAFKHEQNLASGNVAFKGNGHVIFIGWNERTRQLIDITVKNDPDIRIILIDQTLNHLAYQHYPVHFIHGDATEDQTLNRANIEKADRVIITADISKKERSADNYTILTTVAIRGNNKDIPIIAEILSKIQIENAKRAGATTIIKSNDFMSALLFHELSRVKTALPFEDVLQLLKSQQFYHTKVIDELVNKSFMHASGYYLSKQQLLLGIIRDDTWEINPLPNFILKENDTMITLASW